MNQSDKISEDDMHDLVVKMLNEVEKDMEIYEIREKPLKKGNTGLKPAKAYRTGELLHYMYIKCNGDAKKLKAMHILEECFYQCTRTALYYINLKDLKTIILRHKDKKVWSINVENIRDIC